MNTHAARAGSHRADPLGRSRLRDAYRLFPLRYHARCDAEVPRLRGSVCHDLDRDQRFHWSGRSSASGTHGGLHQRAGLPHAEWADQGDQKPSSENTPAPPLNKKAHR